jgi:sulfotransferase famil protein
MIISYKHRFIFIKTRKTGSSSIQMALSTVCGDEDIIVCDQLNRNLDKAFSRNPHTNLRQMKLAIAEGAWRSFFKFAFVRNPWDLVVSRYHWENKGMDCSVPDFRRWIGTYVSREHAEPERNARSNIVQHVWETGGGYRNDLQSPFVLEGGELGVQFIGRYATLVQDFAAVCERLGFAAPPLPHLKGGFRKVRPYRESYDEPSRDLVATAFAEDIERFGFTF